MDLQKKRTMLIIAGFVMTALCGVAMVLYAIHGNAPFSGLWGCLTGFNLRTALRVFELR